MADILDSTPLERFKKFLSEAAAGARAFGFELGSGVTALASMGSLIASLGGGKLLKGLASVTLKPLAGLGVRIGTFIATEIGSSTVAQALGGQLSAAFAKVPGVGAVRTGISKLGGALGSPLGKVMGIAAAAAFVVWFADELNKRREENAAQATAIGGHIAEQITSGTTAELEQSAGAIKKGIDDLVTKINRGPVALATPADIDALRFLVNEYNAVRTELDRRAATAAQVTKDALEDARFGTAAAAEALVDEIPTALDKRQAIVRAAAEA